MALRTSNSIASGQDRPLGGETTLLEGGGGSAEIVTPLKSPHRRSIVVSVLVACLWLGSLPVRGANPGAGAGGVVVLAERQPPALSSGLGLDVLGVPTGNGAPVLPEPDVDANRYGPGVLVGFGQVVYSQVDLVIKGRDEVTTLVIARRHLSRRNQQNSIFGPAWAFNYRHTITRDANGNVVMESFGRKDLFKAVAGSSTVWEGTEGRFDRLSYETGKYTLRMPHGTLLEFTADDAEASKPAHLSRISSPNGNTLVFAYGSSGALLERRLETITESFGRTISFFYEDTDFPRGVSRIRDFSGREVVYDYNQVGQLLSVRSPTVTSTIGVNDFPGGKTHKYTYQNHTNAALQHALTSVIFPNQVASGTELARQTWTYRTDAAGPFFGYVETFTLGNQTAGASAELKAGGTFSYRYRTSGAITNELNAPAWEIEVTDRSGTRTDYRVNRLGQILSEGVGNRLRTNQPELPQRYLKSFAYNADGQLTSRSTPNGRKTDYVYASRREHPHNAGRTIPRNSEISLTATVQFPDRERGATQAFHRSEVVYEPVFNLPVRVTGPRGFDTAEKLSTGETDAALRQRFTTSQSYDYMEDLAGAKSHFAPLLGLTPIQLDTLFTTAGIGDLGTDVNGDGVRDQRGGNVIRIDYPNVPRPKSASGENLGLRVGLAGNAEQAQEVVHYNQYGQLVHHRDAEENVTTTAYFGANDPDGDGTVDNTGADGSTGGYVKEIVRDAESGAGRNGGQNPPPVVQIRTFEYTQQEVVLESLPSTATAIFPANRRGIPTATIDPRGIKTAYLVNELDQVFRTVRASAVGARAGAEAGLSRFSYESFTHYDANNNVLQSSIENEHTLDTGVDDLIVANRSYDILDQPRSVVADVGTGNLGIQSTVTYSPSQNPIEKVLGANNPATATDHSKTVFAYDERDIRSVTTLGAEEGEPQQAAFENRINASGYTTQHIDGADADANDAADGAVGGDPTSVKFDGFDRQIEVVDRVGNRTLYRYDSDSNVTRVQQFGPVDQTSTTQVALAQIDTHYDERNRSFRVDRHLFHYTGRQVGAIDAGALDPADRLVSSVTLYDRLGRAVGAVDADDDTFATRYDGLSRVITTVDPLNNQVRNTYDLNGNLIRRQEVEKSPLIATDEVFTTHYTYDALDRQASMVEPNGQTTAYKYDSRSNRIKTIDPLGNETEMVYDRLNRLVETRTYLSANGLNASASNKDSSQSGDGLVTLKQEWDDLSRLTAQIDDQGNRTEYAYDDLNRKVRTTYQDGTVETWEYNDDSDVIKHTNQNGSIETATYDAKSRRTELVVSHPVGLEVGGTTRKSWGYDGLDRVTLTADNNGPGADDDVTYTYVFDSLSRQTRETQKIGALPALNVDAEWQGATRKVVGIYPSGRKVLRSYDALDRLFEIKEASDKSLVSRFEYVGPGRDIRTTYGNGSILDKRNSAGSQTVSGTNPGFDSNRRSLRHEWKTGSGQQITAYASTWNGPAGVGTNRRASEQREHLSNHTDTHGFDSKYRMTGFRRDGSGIGSGGALSTRTLNGADKTVALNDGGSAVAIDLGTNDEYARMNQYKTFGGQPRTYDHNASLDSDGTFKYIQDYNNRIGEIRRASDNATVAKYVYDVNNRRVLRDVGGTKTRYLYEGWQVVEERGGNNVVLRQYVDGRDMDEHIQLKDGVSGSVYYYHSNSQGFVGALTGTTGGSVEFYEYDWYGKPTILGPDRTTHLTTSSVGNSYLFQGRSLDSETATVSSPGLYYFRNRYYSPGSGEFLTIDPLGYWNHRQGNGFSAFGEDGWNEADPMGLGITNRFIRRYAGNNPHTGTELRELNPLLYKGIIKKNLGDYFDGEFDVLYSHGSISPEGNFGIQFYPGTPRPGLDFWSDQITRIFPGAQPLIIAACKVGLDSTGMQQLANRTDRVIIAPLARVDAIGLKVYDTNIPLKRHHEILVDTGHISLSPLGQGWKVFRPELVQVAGGSASAAEAQPAAAVLPPLSPHEELLHLLYPSSRFAHAW